MHIHHIALWSFDIDLLKNFYVDFFDAKSSIKYVNPKKEFQSYFLKFKSGCKLEIMNSPHLQNQQIDDSMTGLSHFAFFMPSKEVLNAKIRSLVNHGIEVVGNPRITGDGYYEAIVLDPDGNRVELVYDPDLKFD